MNPGLSRHADFLPKKLPQVNTLLPLPDPALIKDFRKRSFLILGFWGAGIL